jgi:hypothetical protein
VTFELLATLMLTIMLAFMLVFVLMIVLAFVLAPMVRRSDVPVCAYVDSSPVPR